MGFAAIYRFLARHPLTRDAKAAALWRFLAWQARSRFASGPVDHPWVNGTRLLVSRGMTGATGNVYAGLHEFEDMAFLLHFLRPESLFVDVGANVGSYTILASGAVGARSLSLEPVPATHAHLVRNVHANGLAERVEAVCVGAGAERGTLRFTAHLDTMNRVARPDECGAIEVAIDTLDALVAQRRPELLKIDVEGHEAAVVRGAGRVLAEPGLRALLIEVNPGGAVELAEGQGFRRCRYDPFTRRLSTDVARTNNALLVRDAEFVQSRLASAPAFRVLGRTV